MAVGKYSFDSGSFSRIGGNSFSDTLRLKQQQKQFEIEQARLAEKDRLAAERLAKADAMAAEEHAWKTDDRRRAQQAAEVAGAVTPVEATYDAITPTGVNVTGDMKKSLTEFYDTPEGRAILEKSLGMPDLKKEAGRISPEALPIEPEANIANDIVIADTANKFLYGDSGIVDPTDTKATILTGDAPAPVAVPGPPKVDFETSGTGDLVLKGDPREEYARKLQEEKDKTIETELARIGGLTYDKVDKKYRTPAQFRKAQVSNIDKVMKEQKVPERDRAFVRAAALESLGPRATEHTDRVKEQVKNIASQREAEIKAAGKVKEKAVTEREKSNTAYYKQQEADLKRLTDERKILATLYKDDKYNDKYLAEDAKLRAQQERIRQTLKKQ